MRYRIQIEPLLGQILIAVTSVDDFGHVRRQSTRLYTFEGDALEHGGLVEILGELQRTIAESTP